MTIFHICTLLSYLPNCFPSNAPEVTTYVDFPLISLFEYLAHFNELSIFFPYWFVERWNSHVLLVRVCIGITNLKISLVWTIKIEHVQNLWSSNHTPKQVPKINISTCLAGGMHMNAHKSTVASNKILETAHITNKKIMDENVITY